MEIPILIKTPQLIGIIAGVIVFIVTISVVFYLLYASGSFAKLIEELQSDHKPKAKKAEITPQFHDQPQLYDELLSARKALTAGLQPIVLSGQKVAVRKWAFHDITDVHSVCDGRAAFNESAYELARIWGWLDVETTHCKQGELTSGKVWHMLQTFNNDDSGSFHLTILDVELLKAIGMVTLTGNCPHNLSIRIGKKFQLLQLTAWWTNTEVLAHNR